METETDQNGGEGGRLRMLESVLAQCNDAVLVTEAEPIDAPGPRIVYVNPAFTRMTGYAPDDVIGATPRILQGARTSRSALDRIRRALETWSPVIVEVVNYRKDGTEFNVELSIAPVADENGWYTHWISVQRDMSERRLAEAAMSRADLAEAARRQLEAEIAERARIEEQLAFAAEHDSLTKLPNRILFLRRLRQMLERERGGADDVDALLFIDLDRFKVVNDSLGHLHGDKLLIAIANRLQHVMRSDDVLARLGGDEFTVLIQAARSRADVRAVVDRIFAAFDNPFVVSGEPIYSSASIGIAYLDDLYASSEQVLRDADIAMYQAKAEGRRRCVEFRREEHHGMLDRLRLENDVRHGIEQREFRAHYQPIFDLRTSQLIGFEALARWHRSEQELLMPEAFIAIAEEIGAIGELGALICEQACADLGRFDDGRDGDEPLFVSINLAPQQLVDPAASQRLFGVLETAAIDLHRLTFEITESALLADAPAIHTTLARLHELGARVVLDDFGTGYSSLSSLHRFPIDGIKIDRSFVSGRDQGLANLEIVRTLLALGTNLDLTVTAEGIETTAQLERLIALGCETGQGYLLAKPASREALTRARGSRSPESLSR